MGTVKQAEWPLSDLFLSPDIWSRLMTELSRVSHLLIHSRFPWVFRSTQSVTNPVSNPTFFVISPTTPPFAHAMLTVANNSLFVVLFASLK